MILNWVLNQKGNDDIVGAAGLLVELNGAPGLEGGAGSEAGGCIAVAEEAPTGAHRRDGLQPGLK